MLFVNTSHGYCSETRHCSCYPNSVVLVQKHDMVRVQNKTFVLQEQDIALVQTQSIVAEKQDVASKQCIVIVQTRAVVLVQNRDTLAAQKT